MKRVLIAIGLLVSIAAVRTVFAQSAEGVITYEQKMNMHRRLPPERENMKSMIPEFRTSNEQLFFKPTESIYKPVIEDEEEPMGGGGGSRIRFMRPSVEQYLNQETGKIISKQEFNGKEYLIEDSVRISPWKFGTETKTIMGYECRQAYYTTTEEVRTMRMTSGSAPEPEVRKVTQEITAWYTDKLRPYLGPERFNTLPGAVLAIDVNNGERVIVATKIETRALKKNEFKIPSSGTKVTQAEFRKLMEEQMQKMRANGGAGMMIRN
ncbi:MAG: GLPGLI family protein [Cytophaga sp.]|nr:GLPGLI family protein [Cytophaga sp.]